MQNAKNKKLDILSKFLFYFHVHQSKSFCKLSFYVSLNTSCSQIYAWGQVWSVAMPVTAMCVIPPPVTEFHRNIHVLVSGGQGDVTWSRLN